MKKQLLLTSAAVLAAVSMGAAQAFDGEVSFTGEILKSTCKVDATSTKTVALPKIASQSLSGGAGKTAGDTGFSLLLSGCFKDAPGTPAPLKTVAVAFDSGDMVNTNGRLNVTGASGVELQILNATGGVVKLGAPKGEQNVPAVNIDTSEAGTGSARMDFTVRYYAAADTVGEGAITSKVKYTLVYP